MSAPEIFKYHALGNDFLIVLEDPAGTWLEGGDGTLDPVAVRRVCDRHRGVGADGVIVSRAPATGTDARMELHNADGGRAETSGNGLRCFALALVEQGRCAGPHLSLETDAGVVEATIGAAGGDGARQVEVTMGRAEVGPILASDGALPVPSPVAGFERREVQIGNPHLVLIGRSLDGVDMAHIGPALEHARPGGQNVEVVASDAHGGLDLVVWERGAGLTEACGSGSCASAAAARASGLVGDEVVVRNPGGTLLVRLAGPTSSPSIRLEGPAVGVARIEALGGERYAV